MMINDEYVRIRQGAVMHLARQTKKDQKTSEDSKNPGSLKHKSCMLLLYTIVVPQTRNVCQ